MTGADSRNGEVTVVALLASILFVAPLWAISVPAMLDGPSRLAELYLLQNLPADQALSHFYEADWTLIPALAGELLILPLARILPLTTAISVFLSLGVIFWVAGPFLVHRAITGKASTFPLFGSLFAYNEVFSDGWWDCYFGMGADLILFTGWVWSRRLSPLLRHAIFAAAAGAMFILHMFACAVLLLLIGTYELGLTFAENETWKQAARKLAWLGSLAVVPMCLYGTSVHVASSGTFEWAPLSSWPHRFGSALQIGPYQPLWFITGPLLTFAAIAVVGGIATVHPRMRFMLSAIGVLCLLMPLSAYGTWGVSFRLPALLCALFFASLEWKLSPVQGRETLAAALGVAVCVVVALFLNWRQFDANMVEFRSALNVLPEGSKVFTAMSDKLNATSSNNVYIHIGEFNITDRRGFSSNFLSTRGQHIVHPVAQMQPMATTSSKEGAPPLFSQLPSLASGNGLSAGVAEEHRNIVDWRCKFDAAVLLHAPEEAAVLPAGLTLVHQGRFFSLAKVIRGKACRIDMMLESQGAGGRLSASSVSGGVPDTTARAARARSECQQAGTQHHRRCHEAREADRI